MSETVTFACLRLAFSGDGDLDEADRRDSSSSGMMLRGSLLKL